MGVFEKVTKNQTAARLTSSSAVADKPVQRAALRQTAKF